MKEKVDLIFKDGDKSKDLLTVVITSEKFEGLQAKMFFSQKGPKKNETFLLYFKWIGDYIPKGDLNWIPQRFFKPAIRQARAIFTKYRHKKILIRHGELINSYAVLFVLECGKILKSRG